MHESQNGTKPRRKSPPDLDPAARAKLEEVLPADVLGDVLAGLSHDQIIAPGGLITQLAGRVITAALEAELTDHLGYEHGERTHAENHRNGKIKKTLATDVGDVEIQTPRDRDGSFTPQLVAKRQSRLAGLDEKIIHLYAGGLSVREIEDQLAQLYGVAIGRDQISRITDAVLDDVAAWRNRPLESTYAVVYLDAFVASVREDRSVDKRACYLAIGVTLEGERETLGIWWQENEGAKFWLAVLNDLNQRGVDDVLIACVDGLTGFPEAIEAVFPKAWIQTCIVHQIRNSMRYVSFKDRKALARDLKPIYTAANAEAAADALAAFELTWGSRYPMVVDSWRNRWELIIPFLSLPADLRRLVYTTNSIENLNRQIRKAIKTRGHFPSEEAATKLIFLAIMRAESKWRNVYNWTAALAALKIHFGDRIPD